MDPADTEALHQASQGTLLGQHDEVPSRVLSSLWELSANVALLLGQSVSSPAAQATAALASSAVNNSSVFVFHGTA